MPPFPCFKRIHNARAYSRSHAHALHPVSLCLSAPCESAPVLYPCHLTQRCIPSQNFTGGAPYKGVPFPVSHPCRLGRGGHYLIVIKSAHRSDRCRWSRRRSALL